MFLSCYGLYDITLYFSVFFCVSIGDADTVLLLTLKFVVTCSVRKQAQSNQNFCAVANAGSVHPSVCPSVTLVILT